MKYDLTQMARVTKGRIDLTPTKDEERAAHEWMCKVDPDYAGRVQLTSNECQAAVDAAIEARLKDDSEFEDVPPSEWKVGDMVECFSSNYAPSTFVTGVKYLVSEINENGAICLETCGRNLCIGYTDKLAPRCDFRLRRPKNPAFVNGVVDLSKAAVGSAWRTRDGRLVIIEKTNHTPMWPIIATLPMGITEAYRLDGTWSNRQQEQNCRDIIGPWKD